MSQHVSICTISVLSFLYCIILLLSSHPHLVTSVHYESCSSTSCCSAYETCSSNCYTSGYDYSGGDWTYETCHDLVPCSTFKSNCAQRQCASGKGSCSNQGYCSWRCLTCSCTYTTYGHYEGSCCHNWKCGSGANRFDHDDDRVCSGRLDTSATEPGPPPDAGRGTCTKPNECECSSCYGHGFGTPAGEQSICAYFRCNGKDANDPDVCSGHGGCGCAPNPNLAAVSPYPSYEPCRKPCDCLCDRDANDEPKWEGTNCEYPVCNGIASNRADVCNGRGTCSAPGVCNCVNTGAWGYEGDWCERLKCGGTAEPSKCGGPSRGVCKKVIGGSVNECECKYGYTGTECELYTCANVASNNALVCNGGNPSGIASRGSCVGVDTCSCNANWGGSNCELHKCNGYLYTDSRSCGAHGSCVTDQTTNSCSCDAGWRLDAAGEFCTVPICYSKNVVDHGAGAVCSGHGTCTGPDSCSCNAGYGGSQCQYNICYGLLSNDGDVCSGHGSCNAPDTCGCTTGYTGDQCEKNVCNSLADDDPGVCSAHGQCIAPDTCSCEAGYTGDDCELPICYGLDSDQASVCSGHGTCDSPEFCSCAAGYGGEACQFNICYGVLSNETSTVCSGHGSCNAPDTCGCTTGYTGDQCEKNVCNSLADDDPAICSSHGQCNAPDTCSCEAGYTGNDCQYPICYGLASNQASVCTGHGTCDSPEYCSCAAGYGGESCQYNICFGTLSNETNVCTGHGSCTAPNTCDCVYGYPGPNCNYYLCDGIISTDSATCAGHGACVEHQECSCTAGWTGDTDATGDIQQCDKWTCASVRYDNQTVCSSHGACTSLDTCKCDDGFFGSNCENFYCHGIPSTSSSACLSRGTCITYNQCNCTTPGYVGRNCEYPVCFGIPANDTDRVCSDGQGFCFAPDSCSFCKAGYTGTTCELSICNGIPANETNVCNYRGSCESPDQCSCSSGFGGSDCEFSYCFGILANESSVCSGHGECPSVDHCVCTNTTMWEGAECEIHKCFNVSSQDTAHVCSGHGACEHVDSCSCDDGWESNDCSSFHCHPQADCSGHGTCAGPETCHCDTYWQGTDCDVWTCFDVPHTSAESCSSHGNCVSPQNCSCDSKWSGERCQIHSCFGIPSNETEQVCSSHGFCQALDTCVCSENWMGKNCSINLKVCSDGVTLAQNCTKCSEDSKNCESSVAPVFRVTKEKMTGTFIVAGRKSDTIECSKVLSATALSRAGSNPICHWEPGTDNFEVIFGEGATIEEGDILQVNIMPLDEENPVFTAIRVAAPETVDPSPPADTIRPVDWMWLPLSITSAGSIMFCCCCAFLCLGCLCFTCIYRMREKEKLRQHIHDEHVLRTKDKEKMFFDGSRYEHDPMIPSDDDEDDYALYNGASKATKIGFSRKQIVPAPHLSTHSSRNSVSPMHHAEFSPSSRQSTRSDSPFLGSTMTNLLNYDQLKAQRLAAEQRVALDREERRQNRERQQMERQMIRNEKKSLREGSVMTDPPSARLSKHSVSLIMQDDVGTQEGQEEDWLPDEETQSNSTPLPGFVPPEQMFQMGDSPSQHESGGSVNLAQDSSYMTPPDMIFSQFKQSNSSKAQRQAEAEARIQRKKQQRLQERLGSYRR